MRTSGPSSANVAESPALMSQGPIGTPATILLMSRLSVCTVPPISSGRYLSMTLKMWTLALTFPAPSVRVPWTWSLLSGPRILPENSSPLPLQRLERFRDAPGAQPFMKCSSPEDVNLMWLRVASVSIPYESGSPTTEPVMVPEMPCPSWSAQSRYPSASLVRMCIFLTDRSFTYPSTSPSRRAESRKFFNAGAKYPNVFMLTILGFIWPVILTSLVK